MHRAYELTSEVTQEAGRSELLLLLSVHIHPKNRSSGFFFSFSLYDRRAHGDKTHALHAILFASGFLFFLSICISFMFNLSD